MHSGLLGRTSAKVRATKSRRNFSQRMHPMCWCISYYLGVFGTVWLPQESRCKRAELVQKFVPRSRVQIFRNKRTQSTPFDPKLMFWCISYHLGAFGTVCLPYETRCKTDQTSAKVRAMKSRQNFSHERTRFSPLDPKLMFRRVSYYLGAFRTVCLPYKTWCKTGRTSAKVCATKSRRNFSQ